MPSLEEGSHEGDGWSFESSAVRWSAVSFDFSG